MKKEKENVVMICRRHCIHFALPGIIDLMFLVFTLVSLPNKSALFYFVVVLILTLYIFITYKSDYLELTETKLTEHRGFIRSHTKSTPLARIQNITYSNGLLGKIFRYHVIRIDNAGTGGTEFAWKHMANAKEFVDKVQALIN